MPTVAGSGMRPSLAGSGKFGTPWTRTHRENSSPCAFACCSWAELGPPAAVREQVIAGSLGRLDLRTAGAELLQTELGLVERTAAVRVGPVRHAM